MESLKAGARFGEYLILRTIGKGGQGFVYEAEDSLGLRWALKLSRQIASQEAAVEERFRREARAVSERLSTLPKDRGVFVGEHYGIFDGRFYVKMRLLQGQSLAELLHKEGRLSLQRTLGVVQQVAIAVAAAHQRGVVHRDLKPENIFLTSEAVQVLDWGCLQMLELGQAGQTEGAGPMCTPGYAAPEQYQPGSLPSAKMDSYALGVILFELLSGYHPFLRCGRLHSAANSTSAASPTAEASSAFSQLVHLPRSAQLAGTPSLGQVQYAKTEESEPVSIEPQPTPRAGLIPPRGNPTEVLESVVPEPGLSGPVTRTAQPEGLGLAPGGGAVGQPGPEEPPCGHLPLPLHKAIELQYAGKVPSLPGVPQAVANLVGRLVAVDPRQRPDVQEVVELVGSELTRLGGEPLKWADSVNVASLGSDGSSVIPGSGRRVKIVRALFAGAVVSAALAASLGLWLRGSDGGQGAQATLASVEGQPAQSGSPSVTGAPSAGREVGSKAAAASQQTGPRIQPAHPTQDRGVSRTGEPLPVTQAARAESSRAQTPRARPVARVSTAGRQGRSQSVAADQPKEQVDTSNKQSARPSLRLQTSRARAQMRKRLESQLSNSVEGKGARKQ